MEQRISLITLGVADLQRAVNFYEQIVGWKAEASPPGVAFFDLNGVVFALWPHDELAKDMGVTKESRPGYPGYALAQNARNEAEVDAIFDRLKKHGATILKQPQKAFWGGYSVTSPTRMDTHGRLPTTHFGPSRRTDEYR
jgi:hypothetical protein